jgi:dihydroxy-acid dehydratase
MSLGKTIKILLEQDIRTSTREAFENAITMVAVLGGSTNAVMHYGSFCRYRNYIDDFQRIMTKRLC